MWLANAYCRTTPELAALMHPDPGLWWQVPRHLSTLPSPRQAFITLLFPPHELQCSWTASSSSRQPQESASVSWSHKRRNACIMRCTTPTHPHTHRRHRPSRRIPALIHSTHRSGAHYEPRYWAQNPIAHAPYYVLHCY